MNRKQSNIDQWTTLITITSKTRDNVFEKPENIVPHSKYSVHANIFFNTNLLIYVHNKRYREQKRSVSCRAVPTLYQIEAARDVTALGTRYFITTGIIQWWCQRVAFLNHHGIKTWYRKRIISSLILIYGCGILNFKVM